jgi:hypothetical protein
MTTTIPIPQQVRPLPARPPWGATLLLGGMVLGGWGLQSPNPEQVAFSGLVLPELCFARRVLGWNCPLCGGTRSVIHLMNGRWRESLEVHPLGWLVVLIAAVTAIVAWSGYLRQRPHPAVVARFTETAWLGCLGLVILVHVGRWVFR